MRYVCLDFETYWHKEIGYSLTVLDTAQYVRDPRFQAHGMSIKTVGNSGDPAWVPHENIPEVLSALSKWHEPIGLICHNVSFDGFVLSHQYDWTPDLYIDTMGLARALLGDSVENFKLDTVAKYLGLEGKIQGVLESTSGLTVQGLRNNRQLYDDFVAYAKQDVTQTIGIFEKLWPHFPEGERKVMDTTVRMFTQPIVELDEEHCLRIQQEEHHRQDNALADLQDMYRREGVKVPVAADIRSAERFASLLRARGVKVPTKLSKAKTTYGQETYAFAKTDAGFAALAEVDDPVVCQLHLAKSVLGRTGAVKRADKLVALSRQGPLPIQLHYCGAVTTTRWTSSGGAGNYQNLPRKGGLREAHVAPEGHVFVAADLSAIELRVIMMLAGNTELMDKYREMDANPGDPTKEVDVYLDLARQIYDYPIYDKVTNAKERQFAKPGALGCLASDTKVLTSTGVKPIVDVTLSDMLWDGKSWVSHQGLIYQGEKETIQCHKVRMTPDHKVLDNRGQMQRADLALNANTRFPFLGSNTANSLSLRLPWANEAAYVEWNSFAPAEKRLSPTWTTLTQVAQNGVGSARKRRGKLRSTQSIQRSYLMTSIENAYSIDYPHRLRAAIGLVHASIKTMASAASRFINRGGRIAQSFFDTSRHSLAGTTPSWKSTGSITTRGTSRGTSASPHGDKTATIAEPCPVSSDSWPQQTKQLRNCEPVYDILNSGPNARFTVVTPDNRLMVVSNCGYGMGNPEVFQTYALGMGVVVDEATAQKVISAYKKTFPQVPKLWDEFDRQLNWMAQQRDNRTISPWGDQIPTLKVSRHGIHLPSGLMIKYPKLGYHQQVFNGEPQFWPGGRPKYELNYECNRKAGAIGGVPGRSKSIWGGSVTGHTCQALARCILAPQMVKIAERYPVAWCVHDEIICVVREEDAKTCENFILNTMSEPVPWWPDLPLAADAWIGKRYRK